MFCSLGNRSRSEVTSQITGLVGDKARVICMAEVITKCSVRTKGHTHQADMALEGFLFDLPSGPMGQEAAPQLLSHNQGAKYLISNHRTRTGVPKTAPSPASLS